MSSQITCSGYSPKVQSQFPAIRTFQMGEGGIGNVPNSVNFFRGDVNLPLELISLPGRGDLDVKVAIMYQTNIQDLVDTWNLEAPTGIMGLGWNVPYEMIAIDNKNTGSSYNDQYYLVSGGGADRLYQDGETDDGAWNFETGDYKPWDIRYYPKEEKWVIVKENGIKQTYGGKKDNLPENNPYIQWGVKWGGKNGNWIDSTTNTSGQEPIALAWNLAEIRNTWGEKVTFDYEVDLDEIGLDGYKYTRACYLKRITSLDRRTVTFVYQPKHPIRPDDKIKEYQIPHEYTGQPNLHAYQDRYETKFLDAIEVRQEESGSLLFSLKFDYELKDVSLNNLNNGNFFKRYLTGITQENADGESLPGYKFEYYTNVEAPHRGALKNITYATGGIATYTYEKKDLLGTSHKTTIYGDGIPRVWFGGDYVVVTYYDDSGTGNLKISIYSWNGNWLSDEKSISHKLDIDSLQVVTQADFFALSFIRKSDKSDMRVYLFHQEMGRFGKWLYENYSLDLASSDVQTHLAVGSNFVVFCATGSTKPGLYVWNQQHRTWDDESRNINISQSNYALSALGNYFTFGIYNDASKSCELVLYYHDEIYKQWTRKEMGRISPVERDDKDNVFLNWSLGNNSAAATFIKKLGESIDYEVQIYQWDAEFEISDPLSYPYSVPHDTEEPFYYSITTGSLLANVEHLWRYNGSKWKKGNLTLGSENTKFAYGSDLAIASSSNSSDIKVYDPFLDCWTNPNIQGPLSKGEYLPTVSGDFVTIGNSIFYRNSQGQLIKDQQSIPSGVKQDSIINRAPYYIACETEDDQTTVFFLKNGKVVDPDSVSERIYVDNQSKGKPGTMLAGFNTFVTYKGDDFDKASILNLYYVADESIEGRIVDFPVVKVTINDGYQNNQTNYDYDTRKVVLSVRGIVTEYPHVTVIQGSENPGLTPFGKTEYWFYNGHSARVLGFKDFKEAPPYYYSVLHGLLHQQKAYNSTDDEVTRQTVEYDIAREREQLDRSRKDYLYGFLIEQKREEGIIYGKEISRIESNGNGVKREVEYEYDPATGLLRTQTTYNYNSLGEKETLTQTSVYGWEKYDELKKQNILTPVVQATNKTNDQTTAISVSTWKDWGEKKWEVFKTYQAKKENAVFKQWDSSTEPNPEDWLKVSEVISRTRNGVVNDSIDVTGLHSSILLDKQQFYPVAKFVNAAVNEATYIGFEAYESLEGWSLNQGNLSDCVVTGDAHTGVSSLQLKPQITLERQKLSLPNPQQTYILSAWLKTDAGFETDKGKVEAKLQFYQGDTPVGNPIVVEIEGTNNKWKYWRCTLNSSDIKGSQVELEISNQKVTKSLLLDDICFAPLIGDLQANVYESKYKYVTAQLSNHGDTLRYLYDSFQRQAAGIGAAETVNTVTMPYLTRQGKDEPTYVFPQDEPNSVLNINAAEGGVYANFTNGEQWREDWQSSQPGNWKVVNNTLVHAGSSSDSITYQSTASFTNYGVRLSVFPSVTLKQSLGIRIGSQLKVTWTPGQGWTLTLNGRSSPVASKSSIPHEWLLVAAYKAVLFYADGEQIFAQTTADDITGALQLFTADDVAFSNIVTFKNPQIGITYSDGAGKERQTQALEGSNCIAAATVYDVLDRGAIATKTARFDDTLFGYRPTFVETMDWESGILTGEVANYYPDDEGYPYSRTVYETSPLGRPVKQGIPGKEFAVTKDNPHIVTSEYGTNLQGFFAGDPYPSGQYLVEKLTDADGTLVYTLKDQLGRTLAKKAGTIEAGSDVYQTTRSIYDAAGNVVKVLLPNQFDPPTGSQPDAWEITMEYDFLGRMTLQTHPDSGNANHIHGKFIYDKAGRPRFMVDAVGLESEVILYKKYDVIGRLIEDGWFSGNWETDSATLQHKADTDPNYPEQDKWRKKYIFDGDGSNPYLAGRLWKVFSSNQGDGNSDVEEVYEYDQFGNVKSKTLTVEGYPPQLVGYEYDNSGNVTRVSYPENSHIPEVVYRYNSLGETIHVGTPDNPQRFAAYTYNADGSLKTTNLDSGGVNVNIHYNPPGWPREIANRKADNSVVMQQALFYTKDGYEGSGYFNGNIAKNSVNYGNLDYPPGDYDYLYQYDKLGRLQVAQNSQNEQASLGVGEPTTYDINGNIETLKRGETNNKYDYIENTDKVKDVIDISLSETQSYSYDANGNVKTAPHRRIAEIKYDPLTRLTTRVQLEGATSVSFKYDGGNQRVLKTSRDSSGLQTAAKLYVHGLNDYPLLEASDQPVQYIYGIGGLLALVKDGKVYTVLKDHLGSTRVVVDEAGTVIAAFDYLPFGDLMGAAYGDPGIISYRYTGQEFDAEVGLYNYRARFYDPRLGRFYAIDPKAQFASPYLYAGNNPINMVDPDGELAFLTVVAIGLVVGAIGGGIAGGVKAAHQGLSGAAAAGEIFKWAGIGAAAGGVIAASGAAYVAAGKAIILSKYPVASSMIKGAAAGSGIGALVGFINAFREELPGWEALAYIAGNTAIGAVGGALGAGVQPAAMTAGTAAISMLSSLGVTSTGAIMVGGIFGGAVAGSALGAGIGTATNAAQYRLNEALGVKNARTLRETLTRGAIIGAVGGAVTGAIGGVVSSMEKLGAHHQVIPQGNIQQGVQTTIFDRYKKYLFSGKLLGKLGKIFTGLAIDPSSLEDINTWI